MTLWVILTSFVLILATGASIGVALGLSSAIVLYAVLDMPLIVVVQRMFTSVDSFSFMAVPFFMLAGAFMSDGGVTRRIVDFSMALVGALAGGLALVVAVAGMFFAALSGLLGRHHSGHRRVHDRRDGAARLSPLLRGGRGGQRRHGGHRHSAVHHHGGLRFHCQHLHCRPCSSRVSRPAFSWA